MVSALWSQTTLVLDMGRYFLQTLNDVVTVGLACNCDGTEMLKPVIVHKSMAPRAFKQKTFMPEDLCYWFANKSAWVTSTVLKELVTRWNHLFEWRGRSSC